MSLVDDLGFGGGVQWPSNMMIFRKSLLSLDGVLRDLSPRVSLDLELLLLVGRQAARDWPRRLVRGPFRRDFGTHLSNADLLPLMLSGPGTTARFWRQTLRDLLAT